MADRRMTFGAAAREKVLQGATQLADAVRITLGPRSKSVLIQRAWGVPLVCNDGVTIAKELRLADPEENLGVQMLRQAAQATGEAVGDGTSTATILAHAMFADGVRNVTAGASAIEIKRGLDRALAVAVKELLAVSRPVSTRRERAQVASISAHDDRSIGELVAEATEKVGGDGVIAVEESRTTETTLEVVEGLQFDRGYISPYFVTDPEHLEAVHENPLVLLTDRRLAAVGELLPLLEQLAKGGAPLLVVAEDVEGEALATLVVNHARGVLKCVAVKAPGYGDSRKVLLADLAAVTGGELVSAELGRRLEDTQRGQLGRARRVVVDREHTTIIGGGGNRAAIEQRVAQIRLERDRATSDYERGQFERRIARLAGGVAVIRVGAPSEAETKARKDALDDAISATRAAVAEGIVPGGGLALLRLVPAVQAEEGRCEGDQRTGVQILRRALEAPTRQIAANSAVDSGVVVARLMAGDGDVGYDAAQGQYVDLYAAGIVDPTKVLRVALENAVSVASTLLLTEATLVDVPEPAERSARSPAATREP
ncbi:MAG: chaperonin GroEL [Steroidobacteraceae bacterium]|nr:chaperonin GroEL [Steroidobacteraceae bacterium]